MAPGAHRGARAGTHAPRTRAAGVRRLARPFAGHPSGDGEGRTPAIRWLRRRRGAGGEVVGTLIVSRFAHAAAEWRGRRGLGGVRVQGGAAPSPSDRVEIFFSLTALAAALALTVLNPWGSLGRNVLLGRPYVAELVGDSVAVTACWLGLLFLEELRAGRLAAPLVWLYTAPLVVVLAIIWVAFVTMPAAPRAAGPLRGYAGGPPGPPLSRLAYFAYPGWICGTVPVRSHGWSRVVQRPSLKVALTLTSAGALLGIPYVVLEVEQVLTDGCFSAMDLQPLTGGGVRSAVRRRDVPELGGTDQVRRPRLLRVVGAPRGCSGSGACCGGRGARSRSHPNLPGWAVSHPVAGGEVAIAPSGRRVEGRVTAPARPLARRPAERERAGG